MAYFREQAALCLIGFQCLVVRDGGQCPCIFQRFLGLAQLSGCDTSGTLTQRPQFTLAVWSCKRKAAWAFLPNPKPKRPFKALPPPERPPEPA